MTAQLPHQRDRHIPPTHQGTNDSANRKQKQQRDNSIVLGGVRMHRRISSRDLEGRPGQRPLVNKKRNAALVVEQSADVPETTQQHWPRKRRKTNYLQEADVSL